MAVREDVLTSKLVTLCTKMEGLQTLPSNLEGTSNHDSNFFILHMRKLRARVVTQVPHVTQLNHGSIKNQAPGPLLYIKHKAHYGYCAACLQHQVRAGIWSGFLQNSAFLVKDMSTWSND